MRAKMQLAVVSARSSQATARTCLEGIRRQEPLKRSRKCLARFSEQSCRTWPIDPAIAFSRGPCRPPTSTWPGRRPTGAISLGDSLDQNGCLARQKFGCASAMRLRPFGLASAIHASLEVRDEGQRLLSPSRPIGSRGKVGQAAQLALTGGWSLSQLHSKSRQGQAGEACPHPLEARRPERRQYGIGQGELPQRVA